MRRLASRNVCFRLQPEDRCTWNARCIGSLLWEELQSMPEKSTIERARRDKREGKAASTQAGEFVREELHHIREGKRGARSTKQAIAIGLSKARRSGVALQPPQEGRATAATRRNAKNALRARSHGRKRTSSRRSRATSNTLKREGRGAASHAALSRQAKGSARRRSAASRSAAAREAARTNGPQVRRAAAKKAANTRHRRRAAAA
jgi:hypothetical protein